MAITKPSWLRDALSSDWLNLERGEWVDWGPVVVPPFSFTPGLWIETAADWLLNLINAILIRMAQVWDKAVDAWNKALEALGRIDNWLSNAWAWFTSAITSWWESTKWTVLGWIDNVKVWVTQTLPGYLAQLQDWVNARFDAFDGVVDGKFTPFRPILDWWNTYSEAAVSFFSDPFAFISAALGDALELFLKVAGWPFLHAIESFLDRIWEEEE